MADKSLVIVESPTKARTIVKFLDKNFTVKASNGHIRDLPTNASEIPESLKGNSWSSLGVNVESDFEPIYVIPDSKKKQVKELKAALKEADILYLATDEDREGESISWHLLEILKPKIPVERLVFHEITREAIKHAIESPRAVNEDLVRAQETRRIVDRLFGYKVSPILWKKMATGLSAGRVQSVAIKLLVEREKERMAFKRASYWGLRAELTKDKSASFEATLTHVDNKRIASGKDFDPNTGKLAKEDVVVLDEARAKKLQETISNDEIKVRSVSEKPYTSKPAAPFVTSTLQQEGNRKLRLSAKRTMTIAQQLYENGFITYMRTDSTTLSNEAINTARSLVKENYGDDYLPDSPRIYKTKVKNAQEAHEAIRPAGDKFATFEAVRDQLGPEAAKLYELIWKRTVACQMKDAKGTHISVEISSANMQLRASGKTITFPGFLRAYVEGSDDPEADLADQERILPKMAEGDALALDKAEATEHSTQPPARFTEGSLIKELEKRGIGRPSTWASVVELVLSRAYAFKKGSALVPTFTAIGVVNLLEQHFEHLVDYEFTARLEDDLDRISLGKADSLNYLNAFYNGNGYKGLKNLVEQGEEKIDPREVCGIPMFSHNGTEIEVRIGRYGPFLSDGERRAALPDELPPDELEAEMAEKLLHDAAKGPEELGKDPESGKPIYLKTGRFGPYVQLGDQEDGGDKPKMASLGIMQDLTPEDTNLEIALKLLSLPRDLGEHPEMKEPVIAAHGRYGAYVKCGKETRSIPADQTNALDITLEQAIELLKQPKGRSRRSAKILKELGKHPVTELEVVIKSGQYGPYVTDGELNASLKKGSDPEKITMEEAVELLEARAARGGKRKKKKSKAKAKKKTATKKKTTSKKKKTSAKKKTTTKKKANKKK